MTTTTTYKTRPIKRQRRPRRTKNAIQQLRDAIHAVVEEDQPMTVRQVFYRLVSAGVIAKSESQYKNTVCRLLGDMRRDGSLPYEWIADNTRWMRKPRTYTSLAQMLELTAETYRRALWGNQDAYVELWLEKEALAGVLYSVTQEWDVPLMVTRGYPSLSYLHSAGECIRDIDRPVFLYYFGDRDPSGVDIPRHVESSIREFAPDTEIHFECVAVTVEQITEYQLQTRPTKSSDSRSKSFDGESVEVDAIPPRELRRLAERCITKHIDQTALERLNVVEEQERLTLQTIADNYRD